MLSSVGWFGIALGVALCGLAAARTADAGLTRALYRTMAVTPWVSIPTGLVAIGTGVLLSLGTIYGLVRYWWVAAKITIAAAIVPTDALLVARAAHNAAVSGSASHVLYGATIAHVVVLGVATVLSVFKPWGRTPMGRRR